MLIYSTKHGGRRTLRRSLETQWTLEKTMGAPEVVFKQIFGDHWNDSIFLITEEKLLRTSNTW